MVAEGEYGQIFLHTNGGCGAAGNAERFLGADSDKTQWDLRI